MSKKESVINPNTVNIIAASTELTGDLKTDNDIKFDGKLNGKIITKSKLVLGDTGQVIGEVYCKSAFISGKVKGKIFVEDIITLHSSSRIEGDISTQRIAIEPGTVFNGNCTMGESNIKIADNIERE